jgi:hypothetical protein
MPPPAHVQQAQHCLCACFFLPGSPAVTTRQLSFRRRTSQFPFTLTFFIPGVSCSHLFNIRSLPLVPVIWRELIRLSIAVSSLYSALFIAVRGKCALITWSRLPSGWGGSERIILIRQSVRDKKSESCLPGLPASARVLGFDALWPVFLPRVGKTV